MAFWHPIGRKNGLSRIFSPNSCESTDQQVFDTYMISCKNFSSNQKGFDALIVEKRPLEGYFRQILANQQINAFLTITWLQIGPMVVYIIFFWWINISMAFYTHIGKIFFRLLKIIVFNFMRLDIINKSTRKKNTHMW